MQWMATRVDENQPGQLRPIFVSDGKGTVENLTRKTEGDALLLRVALLTNGRSCSRLVFGTRSLFFGRLLL